MRDTYYVGAYWGARKETVAECARRAEHFFQLLARCDPSFLHWYRAGRGTPGAPGHPVRTEDVEELEALLLHGRVRTDVGSQDIEDLGWGLRVWNQGTRERTSINVRCGGYAEGMSNACLLNLPTEGAVAERLLDASTLARVLTGRVLAWEPDFGVANSHASLDLVTGSKEEAPDVGWVTYLSHRHGSAPPLPAPVRIEPVGSLGMFITLTPERLTPSTPEHRGLAERVRELLDRAGLLRPPRP